MFRFMGVAGALLLSTVASAAAVNVNTADSEALTALDGVGSVIAERIVAERDAGGPYESAEGMAARVDGLGNTFVESNAEAMRFSKAAED